MRAVPCSERAGAICLGGQGMLSPEPAIWTQQVVDVDGEKRERPWGWNWRSSGSRMGYRETQAHTHARAAEKSKNLWKTGLASRDGKRDLSQAGAARPCPAVAGGRGLANGSNRWQGQVPSSPFPSRKGPRCMIGSHHGTPSTPLHPQLQGRSAKFEVTGKIHAPASPPSSSMGMEPFQVPSGAAACRPAVLVSIVLSLSACRQQASSIDQAWWQACALWKGERAELNPSSHYAILLADRRGATVSPGRAMQNPMGRGSYRVRLSRWRWRRQSVTASAVVVALSCNVLQALRVRA